MVADVRGLPESHGVVALAHDLVAGPVQELGQPADAAHKEAGVDVEENDGWVAVGVLPVGKKRGLNRRDISKSEDGWKEIHRIGIEDHSRVSPG